MGSTSNLNAPNDSVAIKRLKNTGVDFVLLAL